MPDLPRVEEALDRGLAAGWHLGAQLYVSRDGEVVASRARGEAHPGTPMREDSLSLWLSATKPVTAVAMAQLWESERLHLDDPVALHVPEFAQNGKGGITIRHLLTHTAGFRNLRFGWPDSSWEEIITNLCALRPEPRWIPGEKAGYHMSSSWFILGEILRRIDGRSISEYVREEIFEPLGLTSCWIGMPRSTFETERYRLVRSYDTSSPGHPPEDHGWHEEAEVVGCSPGGNGRGPIAELGRFYEALQRGGELDGRRILAEPTVAALVARHRVGMFDHTFRHTMDWGLGFIPNSSYLDDPDLPYHYGPHASTRTWGHSGYRSTCAFCDPRAKLVLAVAFNGTPSESDHRLRMSELLDAVYRDLGLAAA